MKKSKKFLIKAISWWVFSISVLAVNLILAKPNRLFIILMYLHGGLSITAGFADMALSLYYKEKENGN